MNKCSIAYMDYFIPKGKLTIEEILQMNTEHPSFQGRRIDDVIVEFKNQSKLTDVSIFSEDDSIHFILEKMVARMKQEVGIDFNKIKYLVCGNSALMEGNISAIHYIHNKFNMKNSVILPIIQPCVSTLLALGLSDSLLGEDDEEYMLIISARKCENIKNRFVGFTVMGDGVSLVLVKNKPGVINISHWNASNNGKVSVKKAAGDGVFNNVLAIQKHIITNGISFISDSLKQFQCNIDEIDTIICVNTNYQVWHNVYPDLLGIDRDKFYVDNIEKHGGHLNDVDYIRNLKDFMDNENMKKGKEYEILIYGADLVLSYDLSFDCLLLNIINEK